MARRTRSRKTASPASAPGEVRRSAEPVAAPVAETVDESAEQRGRRRWMFVAAAIVTAVWLLALGGLIVGTANPVTLNRLQIEAAEAIVAARVLDRDLGTVAVENVWSGGPLPDEIRVANLSETAARGGRSYLMPLSRAGAEQYEITPTGRRLIEDGRIVGRVLDGRPAVYPPGREAVEQLERILARRRAER